MRLSADRMYQRMLASDSDWDGQFFTGVLTTGIYCLPSCKARKPRRENVRFFPTCEAARQAGLRPCRKCHPDDYARGADPVLEDVELLAAEIRSSPAAFPDARAIVRRSGFGTTRLFELFRRHLHSTPADVLTRARVAHSKRLLLTTSARLVEIAAASGFESQSSFHEQFRSFTGMTPAAYRELAGTHSFRVSLPEHTSLPYLLRALGRDPHSPTERLVEGRYTAAVRLSRGPALLNLELGPEQVRVEVSGGSAPEAHAVVTGLLGMEQDASGFARLARKLGLERLVSGREGLRIVQTPSVYDGLLWSIIGQQVHFAFACTLKRRLVERAGEPLEDGLLALPTPASVAALSVKELAALQFSTKKAEYVIGASRLVAEGALDLDRLGSLSATRAERTLLAVRGLGPWAVNYLMMRSLGFADCVPLGDTGVTSGLKSLLSLEQRPDVDATRRLMSMFSPYRSLATTHLWQFNQPAP